MESHPLVRQGRDFGDLASWMKSILIAKNLWGTIDPLHEDNESSCGLREKEEKTLQVIRDCCGGKARSAIAKEKKPNCAWEKLVRLYYTAVFSASDKVADIVAMEQFIEAIESKDWEFVDKLLTYWPDLKVAMKQILQVLFVEVLKGRDWEAVERLLMCCPYLKASLDETFAEFVKDGDWETIENLLVHYPHLGTVKVTSRNETALHVAVHGGKEQIVNRLVERMEDLKDMDSDGYSALSMAVIHGKSRMVECILRKDSNLIVFETTEQRIPVVLAIEYRHEKMVVYLYDRTPLEYLIDRQGIHGATVCTRAIYNGMLEVALDLITRHRPLVLEQDVDGRSPLYALASTPDAFLHVKRPMLVDRLNCLDVFHHLVSITIGKGSFKLAHELLDHMCHQISISSDSDKEIGLVSASIHCAICKGSFDFISKILKESGVLMWPVDPDGRTILSNAILHRQAKIFREILKSPVRNIMINSVDKEKNNILHMAGMLGPKTLQHAELMQNELWWFKEVRRVVLPLMIYSPNKDGLTPQQLFTKSHMGLREEAEKSMRITATICGQMGALIMAMALVAVSRVLGGYNRESGLPTFLNKKAFELFMVCDFISFLFSSTSVLIFWGILLPYADEESLESLPKKMTLGRFNLFFSIVIMMIGICVVSWARFLW